MNELAWLVEHRFQSITRREYDWVFSFDKDVSPAVSCLWRLVEGGRIRLTSQDEGQQFGLPAPVNAVEEINRRLALGSIIAVELREGLLDLEIRSTRATFFKSFPIPQDMKRGNFLMA